MAKGPKKAIFFSEHRQINTRVTMLKRVYSNTAMRSIDQRQLSSRFDELAKELRTHTLQNRGNLRLGYESHEQTVIYEGFAQPDQSSFRKSSLYNLYNKAGQKGIRFINT